MAVGHFVCAYYDTKNIKIYDSFNNKYLHDKVYEALQQMYPYYFAANKAVQFTDVQSQCNGIDCGVFSIAFAISLHLGYNPESIEYHASQMRPHLI